MLFGRVSREIILAHPKTNSSIFSYQTRLELRMRLACQMKLKNEIISSKHSRWVRWTQGYKVPHVYNEIYCCIFDVVGLYFCLRSWTSCLDTCHCGLYQIPTDKKLTDFVRNLIMGHVWIFQPDNNPIIQTQTSKTTHKWVPEHKTKLLLWPFQSSDLNPVENEWREVNWRAEAQSWSCEPKGSGVILDEGMVSDLLSGVL